MEDQNQTTHDYSFDGVGRLLSDTATVPTGNPANIDTTVASIDYAYKVCGKLLTVSSEDSTGTVLNQVKFQYDSNGNLVKEFQEHGADGNGQVTPASLYVGYGYDDSTSTVGDPALGGSVTVADTAYRPTTLQYPTTGGNSSRVLTDSYGATGSTNDEINRLDSILDGTGSLDTSPPTVTTGQNLDTLGYLGTSTITAETYPDEPNIGYDLLGTTGGTPNLDQFNRVQNMVWSNYGNSNQMLDGYGYTYNLQGDVASRINAVDAVFSELYQYDQLDQLTGLQRGTGEQRGDCRSDLYREFFARRQRELVELHGPADRIRHADDDARSGPHAHLDQRDSVVHDQ